MIRPTPLDDLRRPHPDQARIDREAVELLLRSVATSGGRAAPTDSKTLLKGPPFRGEPVQPGV